MRTSEIFERNKKTKNIKTILSFPRNGKLAIFEQIEKREEQPMRRLLQVGTVPCCILLGAAAFAQNVHFTPPQQQPFVLRQWTDPDNIRFPCRARKSGHPC
jgi:hypothetical protein